MIVKPIYSAEPTSVYHNNNQCTERNNIETINIRYGTGGKNLCKHCKRINAGGK
jgi:hypothetical protein